MFLLMEPIRLEFMFNFLIRFKYFLEDLVIFVIFIFIYFQLLVFEDLWLIRFSHSIIILSFINLMIDFFGELDFNSEIIVLLILLFLLFITFFLLLQFIN